MINVLGTITTYSGREMPKLWGCRVRVVGVLKNALCPDVNIPARALYINDEAVLRRAGGITANDRLEVQPLDALGRPGFVYLDPKADDLEAFAFLKRTL